jgi:predicted nuclease of predicted toxin-antitoxin system
VKLKLLVDVSVGMSVVSCLREYGHDVLSVQEVDSYASDERVLEMAVDQARIVVTMDKDFGELVYKSGRRHRGVLLLRLEDQDRKAKVKIALRIVETHGEQLEGNFCVYQNGRLRIRK